jgi:hypothetical protein
MNNRLVSAAETLTPVSKRVRPVSVAMMGFICGFLLYLLL